MDSITLTDGSTMAASLAVGAGAPFTAAQGTRVFTAWGAIGASPKTTVAQPKAAATKVKTRRINDDNSMFTTGHRYSPRGVPL